MTGRGSGSGNGIVRACVYLISRLVVLEHHCGGGMGREKVRGKRRERKGRERRGKDWEGEGEGEEEDIGRGKAVARSDASMGFR